MPSETVSAPRNLSESLLVRLDDIAERHGGDVPIHGRLFAQWMHHAYPNECAYPHASGSLDAPLTPHEWANKGSDGKRRLKATAEEMQVFVEAAAAATNASEPGDQDLRPAPLPWSDEEELLVALPSTYAKYRIGRASLRMVALALPGLSLAVALVRMLRGTSASLLSAKGGKFNSWPGGAPKSEHVV